MYPFSVGWEKQPFCVTFFSTHLLYLGQMQMAHFQIYVTIRRDFLTFVRLVGTVYFKKHASGFDTPSPSSHFLQFADTDPTVQHIHWIDDIRQNIADRTTFDTSMVPSTDVLYFHWKRTCWVLDMWGQAYHGFKTHY